jgi:tRNA threonylcarbamoyl adenosine modification protein YeaZ
MCWILGLDSTSAELGIGLWRDEQPVAGYSRYIRGSHAEHIAHGVSFMLRENNIGAADISRAGVAIGPGSFTGLRIGIAFVKGMLLEARTPVTPVSSLQSIAYAWGPVAQEIAVALDARQGRVFGALFAWRSRELIRRDPDRLLAADAFFEALAPETILLTDTLGYGRCSVFDTVADRPYTFALERFPIQRGMACARIAAERRGQPDQWHTPGDLLPRYMQLSAAQQRRADAGFAE